MSSRRDALPLRPFGATGLEVPPLGLGAGPAGDPGLSEAEAERLLGTALDEGIALVDTAPSYGLSEERIGRHLARRRGGFVLSTKLGYGVPGVPDWTGPCITAGVERALRLLSTDVLDVAHLHSCPLDVLLRGDVVEALSRAVCAGKARVAAYSGEGDALAWAVDSGAFGAVQASVSVCDQGSLDGPLARAAARGLGVLAKRSLANAAWSGAPPTPGDAAAAAYRERWSALSLADLGLEPAELALRFTAFAPGVSSALAGTRTPERLRTLAAIVRKGPLADEIVAEVRRRWRERGAGWPGMI